MKIIKFDRPLKEVDVVEINSMTPVTIEIQNTKGQNPDILRKLDNSNVIRVTGMFDDKFLGNLSKQDYFSKTLYSPSDICEIILFFEEIESGINGNWNNLQKTTYVYTQLMQLLRYDIGNDVVELKDNNPLKSVIKGDVSSMAAAVILKELLDRLGIENRAICSVNGHYWNEILLGNCFYPADLSLDCEIHEAKQGDEFKRMSNFLSNEKFFNRPEHQARERTMAEMQDIGIMDQKDVQNAVESVSSRSSGQAVNVEEKRPDVKIQSKELSGVFEKDTITDSGTTSDKTIKISVTDENFDSLKSDIEQIGAHYPELLSNIQIANTTTSKINMQEVIDEVFAARKSLKDTSANEIPATITISSSNAEDFNLDFSNAPESQYDENNPTEMGKSKQTIAFKNTGISPVKLPNISSKLSPNIDCISVEGFDVSDFSVDGTDVDKIVFGENNINITQIGGLENIPQIVFDSKHVTQFNDYMRNVYPTSSKIYDITLAGGLNLSGRAILQELAANPNITNIWIQDAHLDNLDGIEQLQGRLARLGLPKNDLDVSDITRINKFHQNTPDCYLKYSGNSGIKKFINANSSRLSDSSYKFLSGVIDSSGLFKTSPRLDRNDVLDAFTDLARNYPFYIKDADLLCRDMHLEPISMMIEDDSEFQTVNFNAPHIKDGSLLLTIPQVEHLIQSGMRVPQKIEISIDNVSELTSDRAKELSSQLAANGNNLSGIRIINKDNLQHEVKLYKLSQYVFLRETLDTVTYDIKPTDSDLDKFATIYVRLANSIAYDHDATKQKDRNSALYYAKKCDSSRNLEEGLAEGKCVCAGYADILRNALALVGINSRFVSGCGKANTSHSYHAWNQVQIDGKWYHTDLTWDRQKDDTTGQRKDFPWMLRGNTYFTNQHHRPVYTKNTERAENADFDRLELKRAIQRAQAKSFDFRANEKPIIIPEDPKMSVDVDEQRIKDEFRRRRDDMLAKYYGNKDYQNEYQLRSARYRQHEEENNINGYTYRTIGDYAERAEDERFLLLNRYRECLERVTRFEAGDTSVYTGTPDQITAAYEKDKEYVQTRNHTFNQFENKSKDLATLGKYGDRVPYIPRQQGIIRNIGRGVANVGIAIRNAVSPIYRAIGTHIIKPMYDRITRGRDASPYRNNIYHRVVARRDFFRDAANQRDEDETQTRIANASDPSQVRPVRHPIRNYAESLYKSVFYVKQGNEAVLRAGAADIMENIRNQEQQKAIMSALQNQIRAIDNQIRLLQNELNARPTAHNAAEVKAAIVAKQANRQQYYNKLLKFSKIGIEGDIQTDAVSAEQHAIASKEITTFETTVIKGVMKGAALKLIGPKVHDWLLEKGKSIQETEVVNADWQETRNWVPTTYKTETTDVYESVLDTSKSMHDIIGNNKGKDINLFYSVYGGERGAMPYTINGEENITAVFQSIGEGGTGLADKVGLTAPNLVDRTFGETLLNSNGLLNQNVTLNDLVDALNTGSVDLSNLQDVYVSISDRGWAKLADLVGDLTNKVKVGEITNQVVDVAGHYETVKNLVTTSQKVSEIVENPILKAAAEAHNKMILGGATMDTILDIVENTRPTTTDVKSNKKKPRQYDYDDEEIQNAPLPTSGREYDESR